MKNHINFLTCYLNHRPLLRALCQNPGPPNFHALGSAGTPQELLRTVDRWSQFLFQQEECGGCHGLHPSSPPPPCPGLWSPETRAREIFLPLWCFSGCSPASLQSWECFVEKESGFFIFRKNQPSAISWIFSTDRSWEGWRESVDRSRRSVLSGLLLQDTTRCQKVKVVKWCWKKWKWIAHGGVFSPDSCCKIRGVRKWKLKWSNDVGKS